MHGFHVFLESVAVSSVMYKSSPAARKKAACRWNGNSWSDKARQGDAPRKKRCSMSCYLTNDQSTTNPRRCYRPTIGTMDVRAMQQKLSRHGPRRNFVYTGRPPYLYIPAMMGKKGSKQRTSEELGLASALALNKK